MPRGRESLTNSIKHKKQAGRIGHIERCDRGEQTLHNGHNELGTQSEGLTAAIGISFGVQRLGVGKWAGDPAITQAIAVIEAAAKQYRDAQQTVLEASEQGATPDAYTDVSDITHKRKQDEEAATVVAQAEGLAKTLATFTGKQAEDIAATAAKKQALPRP